MKDNSKITINFKDKEYEIEKIAEMQKVKPKNGKAEDKEITIKNYKEGKWNHTCEISEDGTKFETVSVKWGTAKHATIWGGIGLLIISSAVGAWYFIRQNEVKED